MKKPSVPANEQARLRALRSYEILDTAPQPRFDALTKLAASILGVPIALVSLVDSDRQWFKSRYGLDAPETPRDVSFCGHSVAMDAPLIVPDAYRDERFSDNPLVTGAPRVRFYAGVPLRTPDGFVLGTLCAIDHEPRNITPAQREALELLAVQVIELLELQRGHMLAQRELAARVTELETHKRFFDLTLDLLCTANSALHFEHLNPAWEGVLGWTLDELRARPFVEFVHPADLEATSKVAGRLLDGSAPLVDFENRYRHKDGHWVSLSWVATVSSGVFFAAARDITARKTIERELRQFKATLDRAQDAIFIFEPDTLRFVYANQGAASHVGYSPEELLAMTPLNLKPRFDELRYRQLLEQLITKERAVVTFETVHRHKDGHDIPVEIVLQYMDPPGEAPRFINVVRDISERKRVETLKSEFISIVSHELRTPLTSIRGALGLVSRGFTGPLPKQAKEYVDIALSNSERLVRLINDILDIEKLQSGSMGLHLQPIDLVAAVNETITANNALAAASDVGISLVSAPEGVEVLVDRDRLIQVLTNLISNAVKFSPAGQSVDVSVVPRDLRVRVSVRDRGPGISEEFRGRIFQRFAQADSSDTRKKGGTGLGLSISKALVEEMKGEIGFEGVEGGGTSFFFDLPWLPSVRANGEVPEEIEKRVLVCEDDLDVAHFLRNILESGGCSVHVAPTLARARELLATFRYRMITLDLMLADGEAQKLISEVRNNPATQDLPIVVISGATDKQVQARLGPAALMVGDILTKPVDEARLLRAIGGRSDWAKAASVRVLHVEDDDDLQRIMRKLLPEEWEVVGAASLADARARLADSAFDVVLLDLSLPDGNGESLLDAVGSARVVIFSATDPSPALSRRVSRALVKSRTSEFQLRDAVVALKAKRTRENPETS